MNKFGNFDFFWNQVDLKKYFNFGKMSWKQALVVLFVFILIGKIELSWLENGYYKKLIENIEPNKTMEELRQEKLSKKIKEVVEGSLMANMVFQISKKDEKTAAYLVAIAKKESNWGERAPVLNGQDCYNYWGYRGLNKKMGSGGHTCFDSPQQAVNVVSRRITQIIKQNKAESAKDMLVWKCGSNCFGHSEESVQKWVKDVDFYAKKILN